MARKHIIVGAVVVWMTLLVGASAASAHAFFVGAPSGFPVDTDQTLTMDVPHERGDGIWNVEVVVALPDGWSPIGCEAKPTWTCGSGTQSGRTVTRFTKDAGAGPAEDERFVFTVHTGSAVGTFSFPTLQTYDTGEQVGWIGPPGSDEPAPQLTTVPSGTPTSSTSSTAPPHGATTTTAPPAPAPSPDAPGSPNDPTGGGQPGTPGVTTTLPGTPATTVAGQEPGATPEATTEGTSVSELPANEGTARAGAGRPGTSTLAVAAAGTETAAGAPAGSSGGAGPLVAGIVVLVLLSAAGVGLIRSRSRGDAGSAPTS